MANGVIPLAKASGVRSRVPSGWTRWNGPLARLHFRQVRSRDHDQRYTEHFDGPAPGANGWPGTRFLVKVDDVGRRQLAEPPSSTPTARVSPIQRVSAWST